MKLLPKKEKTLRYPYVQSLITAHYGLLRKTALEPGFLLSKTHSIFGRGFESQIFLVFLNLISVLKNLKNLFFI